MLTIKAYGRGAEAKLKGLLNLPRQDSRRLDPRKVEQINRIAAELAGMYDPKAV